jgi:hypothetical protein
MATETPKWCTRKSGIEFVRSLGLPITQSTVEDCMYRRGPKACGKLGPCEIYTGEEFLRYAIERVRLPETETAE